MDSKVEVAIPPLLPKQGELTAHRKPLPALTGIRFFAAMYVVFYHSHLPKALREHDLTHGAALLENGLLAVPFFFILSGFILSYTYAGQIKRPTNFRRFWEARFARLWPLYAVSLLLSSLFTHTTPHSPLIALSTLFMIQAWNPFDAGVAGSWNLVCWTLSTEAFFYLWFPWVQVWLERRRSWVTTSLFLVSTAIAVAGATGSISFQSPPGIRGIPLALAHLPEFLIGVCLGNLYLSLFAQGRSSVWFGYILAGRGFLTYLATAASLWLLCKPTHGLAVWTALSFGVLIFALATEDSGLRWLLSTRVLLIGGQISYGIYLLQRPCRAVVYSLCDRVHIHSMPAKFILDCTALILISTFGFFCVEEPARKILRSFFARLLRTTQMRVSARA